MINNLIVHDVKWRWQQNINWLQIILQHLLLTLLAQLRLFLGRHLMPHYRRPKPHSLLEDSFGTASHCRWSVYHPLCLYLKVFDRLSTCSSSILSLVSPEKRLEISIVDQI